MRQVLVDFGKVSVDTTQIERVKIIENCTEFKTYHVIYLCITNAIDRAFQILPYTQELGLGDDLDLEITFSPKLPHYYIDYISVQDESNLVEFVITVKGLSIGPKVRLSQHFVSFVAADNKAGLRQKSIELFNDSQTGSSFQWFLSNGLQGDFRIQSGNCGFIQSRERVNVEIIFTGTRPLLSSAELVCLVHHQAPLFLKVTGTCSTVETPLPPPAAKVKQPYERFMENSLRFAKNFEKISVHDRFLDFGVGDVKDVTMNISQTLYVTNHTEQHAILEWIQDPDQVFIIKPKVASIKPKTSEILGIRFRPKKDNYCYSQLLTGVCHFSSEDPEVANIKEVWFRVPAVGNTWKCEGWPAKCSIPAEVIMPPTVPGVAAYTNFVLSNVGEEPMYYRFLRPDESNFVLLPMVGMISERGWQIISVAMEGRNEGYYSECWEIELNCHKKVRIQMNGSAENALIQIKAGSVATTRPMFGFDPTITGAVSGVLTHIHNMSRNYVHVNMFSSADWLGGDFAGAITMCPNEVLPYQWWFRPEVADQFYETTVVCSSLPLLNGRKAMIEPTQTFINISGYSEEPNIQVKPKTYNFKDITVGECYTYTLTLSNTGVCNVCVLLNHELTTMSDADISDDKIEFDPEMVTIDHSESHSVQVKVLSSNVGDRQANVVFSVLFYSEVDELISLQPEQKTLCTFWYDAVVPTIQVERVIAKNCAGIFSSHRLWKILNIDMFNCALLNAAPNNAVTVNMRVPESYLGAPDIEIYLIIDSMYSGVDWSLQRLQLCDCKMVEVQKGISMKRMVHSCLCRELLELSPLEHTTLPENASELLMTIRYSLEGTNVLAYRMTLSHERRVDIYVKVCVHPVNAKLLAPMSNSNEDCVKNCFNNIVKLDCGGVAISNLDPVIKVLWVYNSTSASASWQLTSGNGKKMSAIRCLTEICEVMPHRHLAVIFSFLPSGMIKYKQEFSAMMGERSTVIEVTGHGSLPNSAPLTSGAPKCMEKRIKSARRSDTIYLSTEHITLPAMFTHSTVTRMFSITNSSDFVISYEWLKEHVEGVLVATVTPVRGIMAAHCTYWMTLTVHTLQYPASLICVIVCETLNLTRRREYECQESAQQLKREKEQAEYMSDDDLEKKSSEDKSSYVGPLTTPTYNFISMSVDLSSISPADSSHMMLRELQQQQPSCDIPTEINKQSQSYIGDGLLALDCILWKMIYGHNLKRKYESSSQRELPSYEDILKDETQIPRKLLSKRLVAAICTSIISKSIHDIFNLHPPRK